MQRAALKSRDFAVDLSSKLGRTQVVGLNAPVAQQAGYFCSVCDCVLRDSASYLDHINGKWHNRALGISMRIEQATAEQVKGRLEQHRAKKAEGLPADHLPDGIDRRIVEAEAAEEEEREARRAAKKAKRERKAAGGDDDDDGGLGGGLDPDMAAMMGFGGFGGGKR